MRWRRRSSHGYTTQGLAVGAGASVMLALAVTAGVIAGGTTTTTTTTAAPTTTTTTVPSGAKTCGPETGGAVCSPSNTGYTGSLLVVTANALPGANGSGDITTAGVTIENVDITGSVGVLANNVTFRNCRVRGQIWTGRSPNGGNQNTQVTGTSIKNCEFVGTGVNGSSGLRGINGVNEVFQYNYFHGYENCATMWGGSFTETNFKLNDNYCIDGLTIGGGPHYDGYEIYGMSGGGQVIGNTIFLNQAPSAAPVNLTPVGHFDGTITVNSNTATSVNCAYVILGDDSQGNTPINATINNNRLTTASPSTFCWTPAAGFFFSLRNSNGGSTYSLSGNVDDVSGSAVQNGSCRKAGGVIQLACT